MGADRILVVGGAGYVGSHFALSASRAGWSVTVLDNLSTGHAAAIKGVDFQYGNLLDFAGCLEHLSANRYDAIFHFAASCLVGESVAHPARYYRNNVTAAFNLLECMRNTGHDRIVLSSTCAVYGHPQSLPLKEDHPKVPISPYGRTKLMIEWMLGDYYHAYGIRSACLRYFNAAGCEPDHGLGEDHKPETHLIPNVVRFALKQQDELVLFGDNYPTPDGTCIRDYIHVTDLADAHLKAMKKLDDIPLLRLNLGTGSGFSNKQVVDTIQKVSGVKLSPTIGPRRPGDPAELVADASEAKRLLDWEPRRSNLEHIAAEALRWLSEHPNGYCD